jgi:hypothetical protein
MYFEKEALFSKSDTWEKYVAIGRINILNTPKKQTRTILASFCIREG